MDMAMTAEQRFKDCVRQLHKEGIYPGPTILNERIHGSKSRNINGRETVWRREVMKELGISLKRSSQRYSSRTSSIRSIRLLYD